MLKKMSVLEEYVITLQIKYVEQYCGGGNYTARRKIHMTRTARQTSSVKQRFAILHTKQHTSRSVNDEISSTNNNPPTCVIGTIYCELLDHFRGVYVCYTREWDLYTEIELSLKPNNSVSKCWLIQFYSFSVLVLFASSVQIVCAHHLRDIITKQRLFWFMSHFTFCLALFSYVFHAVQRVSWFLYVFLTVHHELTIY